jgi:hypothetical protein
VKILLHLRVIGVGESLQRIRYRLRRHEVAVRVVFGCVITRKILQRGTAFLKVDHRFCGSTGTNQKLSGRVPERSEVALADGELLETAILLGAQRIGVFRGLRVDSKIENLSRGKSYAGGERNEGILARGERLPWR